MKFSRLRLKTILTAGVFSGGIILFSCQKSDQHVDLTDSKGEILPVSLTINLSNETDGYTLSADTHTRGANNGQGAFSVNRLPHTETRAEDLYPNSLYNLEIRQYNGSTGAYMNGKTLGNTTIGSKVTIPLTVTDNCQLIIVARGDGNTVPELGTRSLSTVQKDITANSTVMQTLNDINKMPYVLHLKNVRVENAGNGNGIIRSTENGTNDVRLRLKRLAVRLTVSWTYSVAKYDLQQILLQSIPLNYSVVPAPDASDGTYPSLLDQFTTISIPTVTNSGSYSLWVPANVRGENSLATSLKQRTKNNSPTGSSFLNFIAVNNTDTKKKLDYRIYLGGTKASEFNLEMGTNYNYQINFAHEGIPTDDKRVTYIDPIPASEGNENFVPTANCFMVAPGGSFCFDPFMYRQNGADIPNTVLAGWSTQIQSVKLLWQTKENGDVGDPVIGIVNTTHDHTNIVDIKNTDNTSAPYMQGKARIYCRVSANTTGGSGVIAAYDGPEGSGNILWSWHIWVTDYNPSPTGNANVLEPVNKRKQKYVGNGAPDQLPMMDRNLGAFAGYDAIPASVLEMSRANGFHYQQGRKDPFPSSYSKEAKSTIDNIYSSTSPKDMLNLYGPDGLTYKPRERGVLSNIRQAYQNPVRMYTSSNLSISQGSSWAGTYKQVHDPCPAGWRVAAKENYRALFDGDYLSSNTVTMKTPRLALGFLWEEGERSGGYLVTYDNNSHNTYFRMTGFGNNTNNFVIVGQAGNVWMRDVKYTFDFGFNANATGRSAYEVSFGWSSSDAHAIRCIQERAD